MPLRTHKVARADDERGAALAVAVAVAFVVMILGTVAISGSLTSISQSGVADRQVISTDAAEAGLQYVLAQFESASVERRKSFSCSTPHLATVKVATAKVTVACLPLESIPAGPTLATTEKLGRCGRKCTGALPSSGTYLVQATGTATVGGSYDTKTLQAAISDGTGTLSPQKQAPVTDTKSSAFTEALFAGDDLTGSGRLTTIGGDIYSGQQTRCASSGDELSEAAPLAVARTQAETQPRVTAAFSVVTAGFTGACNVKGNLYLGNESGIAITSGSVGRSAYSTGQVSLAGGATVGGSVYAVGPVTLESGARIAGSLHSADTSAGVAVSTRTSIAGDLDSGGPVTVAGKVGGSIRADGPVTLIGADVTGSVYATGKVTVDGGTVGGDVYTAKTVASSNRALVKGSIRALQTGGEPAGLDPLQAMSQVVLADVTDALVAATDSVNGTTDGTTATVEFPTLEYNPEAWMADTDFCDPAACTPGTVDFVTDDDCNLSTRSGGKGAVDPDSVWAVIKRSGSPGAMPTVLQTSCAFTWGDSKSEGSTLPLDANLAIFDSSGFTFGSAMGGGIVSGDGRKHQFYAIVPTSAYRPTSGAGGSSCAEAGGPDVDIAAPLTDSGNNIADFVYTPANVCSSGEAVETDGRVYAGQKIVAGSSDWDQTFADIAPWTISPSSADEKSDASAATGLSVSGGAVTPTWVAQVPNQAG